MVNFSLFLEILALSSIKLFILFLLARFFGIIFGFLLMCVLISVYHFILEKLFGLTALNGYDKVFVSKTPVFRYQVISMMTLSNFEAEKAKKFIFENIFKKIKKVRSKITHHFLEYYWEEVKDQKEIEDRVQIRPKIKDKNALIEYVQKELNIQLDIFKEIPLQILIVPIGEESEKKGAVLFKYDHLLSDGLGLIVALCKISNNFEISIFPKIIQRMVPLKWYEILYMWVVSPYYFITTFFIFAIYPIAHCPYKANKKPRSNNSNFVLSKNFTLKDFEKFRKDYKVSFNDVMMAAFSMAIGKIYEKDPIYSKKKNIVIDLPVGRKSIPKDISNVEIKNEASGVLVDIPIIKKKEEVVAVVKGIRHFFKPEIQFSLGVGAGFFGEALHWKLLGLCSRGFVNQFDYLFTNVPGPTSKLIYEDMICEEIFTFPQAGGGLPIIIFLSYNGEFKFIITANENADWDLKDIKEQFEKCIEEFII